MQIVQIQLYAINVFMAIIWIKECVCNAILCVYLVFQIPFVLNACKELSYNLTVVAMEFANSQNNLLGMTHKDYLHACLALLIVLSVNLEIIVNSANRD